MGAFTIYTLIKIYVSVMQIGYITDTKREDAVLLSPAKYVVAGNYAIKKERIAIAESFIEYFLFLFWVFAGFAWLQKVTGFSGIWENLLFIFGYVALNFIVGLPFDIYRVFGLDKSFNFSKTTPKLYIIDTLKSSAIFLVVGGAIFSLIIYIIDNFSNWWLWTFVVVFTFILFVNIPSLFKPTLFIIFSISSFNSISSIGLNLLNIGAITVG